MAEFTWYLNRQGPRGMQGPQGLQGFSPIITVEEDSLNAYILRIQTQNDTFLTSNLRGTVEDLGGTYVRYNRETGQIYAGSADAASDTQAGIVRMASAQDISELAQDAVVTPFNVDSMIANKDLSSKYVTLNTSQTITGQKSFSEIVSIDNGLTVTGRSNYIKLMSDHHEHTNEIRIGYRKSLDTLLLNANVQGDNNLVKTDNFATTVQAGIIKVDGTTITVDADGTIHGASTYELPTASAIVLGGVKVGEGLEISADGTLKATAPIIDTTNLAKLDGVNYFTGRNNFNTGITAASIMLTEETDKPALPDNAVIIESSSYSRPVLIKPSWMAGRIGLLVSKDGLSYTNEAGDTTDLLAQGGGTSVNDKYGIRGDYSTHFGILDCPNGLINHSATSKDITLQAGVILKAAGNNNIKTTIASPITYTVNSVGEAVLFYAGGEILEATSVAYQVEQPADNGTDAYQAWYNPEVGKWQFKSNETGNVWRDAIATPIANINSTTDGITRVDYIGYRILDDDILVTQQTLAPIQELVTTLQQTIAQLEARIQALETEINGGNA